MPEVTLAQALDLALTHHQAGRLADAERIYRQILAADPRHARALHLLGVVALQLGQPQSAVDLIRQSLAVQPDFPEALSNLGAALAKLNQTDEAVTAYRQAIALRPNYPEAHNNLGNALGRQKTWDAAIAAFRQAVALRPDYADAWAGLGASLRSAGRVHDALPAFRKAIALNPRHADAWINFGTALRDAGLLDDAAAAFRKVIELRPGDAIAHSNLGICLRDVGRRDLAIATLRQAVALAPNYAEAHSNLGNVLRESGEIDPAIESFRRALAVDPASAVAHNSLGSALKDAGDLDAAIQEFRQAITLNPAYHEAHSNLAFTLMFHPRYDAHAILAECRRWNDQHANAVSRTTPHLNDRSPNRRLKIGYVSPDFRTHCQSFFTVPLLSSHDHADFEIHCYSDVVRPDALTTRLQGFADVWRNTVGLTDDQLAARIGEDRIDILVDLTMHMAHNRLLTFARKPAPVQISWLAYPGTAGLPAIDYRISDPFLDPHGADESIYSEQTLRLPETFWCYDPLDGRDIPLTPPPSVASGRITFGSLNNFCKLNDDVLQLWAQILRSVPTARLLLLAPEGSARSRTRDALANLRIAPDRIDFVPFLPRRDYLQVYHRIDIGLDTFPANGHTTSFDSLWMGVPVVTLVGPTVLARAGWCQLSNLNLTDLAAHTPEDFVRIAASLAGDPTRLGEFRATLRKRLEQSTLMNAPRFARNIEAAYRTAWRRWTNYPIPPLSHLPN